VLQTRN